jgi:hypothetical protein
MIRHSLPLAILATLAVPTAAQAFFFRPFCHYGYYAPPPVVYWYAPPVYVLPPVYAPAYECAPATPKAPPRLMDAPKPMEKPAPKVELPKPKEVVPAAGIDRPKVEPAVPMVAVPDAPKPVEKQPDAPKPAPLVLPPEKKKDEKPEAGVPAIPKLNLPLAVPEPAVPAPAVPKADEKKIPEIKLPPIVSESKFLSREALDVRVVPVEGRREDGNRVVNFYNYTDRAMALSVNGQLKALPAKSSLGLALPDSFKWSVGGRLETTSIPADAAGLSVVIK